MIHITTNAWYNLRLMLWFSYQRFIFYCMNFIWTKPKNYNLIEMYWRCCENISFSFGWLRINHFYANLILWLHLKYNHDTQNQNSIETYVCQKMRTVIGPDISDLYLYWFCLLIVHFVRLVYSLHVSSVASFA